MRYAGLLLLGLLTLASIFFVAQAAWDSVEADYGPPKRGPMATPAAKGNDGPPEGTPEGTPAARGDRGKGPHAGDIVPGHYIVRLKDRASPKALAARHGVRPQMVYEAALKGFAGPLSDKDVKRLRADPNVVYVEPDRIVTADDQTVPTGVDRIDADLDLTAKIDGVDDALDVDIAIIDTGIQPDHPDLRVVGGATFVEVGDGG